MLSFIHTIAIKIAGAFTALLVLVGVGNHAIPSDNLAAGPTPAVIQISEPTVIDVGTDGSKPNTILDIPAPQAKAQPEAPAAPLAVPVYVIQVQQPVQSAPLPVTTPTPKMEPTSQARIDIISPIGGLRLGRDLEARAEPLDERNQVLVGAVVYDADGNNSRDAEVLVTTSDENQKADIKGTGDFTGAPQNVYYYSFTYNVHSVGDHTITFKANGVEKSVTFNVSKQDTR